VVECLCLLRWEIGVTTKLCDYTNVPNAEFIAKPITSPEIILDTFEISPRLLNNICEEQFGRNYSQDASMRLHYFVTCRNFRMLIIPL
jgi:hypothetical protein